MASSQGIRAGKAFVELFADDTKLVRGLRGAERKLKAFGAGVQSMGTKLFGLGAAIVAPLAATTNVTRAAVYCCSGISTNTAIDSTSRTIVMMFGTFQMAFSPATALASVRVTCSGRFFFVDMVNVFGVMCLVFGDTSVLQETQNTKH